MQRAAHLCLFCCAHNDARLCLCPPNWGDYLVLKGTMCKWITSKGSMYIGVACFIVHFDLIHLHMVPFSINTSIYRLERVSCFVERRHNDVQRRNEELSTYTLHSPELKPSMSRVNPLEIRGFPRVSRSVRVDRLLERSLSSRKQRNNDFYLFMYSFIRVFKYFFRSFRNVKCCFSRCGARVFLVVKRFALWDRSPARNGAVARLHWE